MTDNNYEDGGRDGFFSSDNDSNNESTQGPIKKKRPRVGELRKPFVDNNNDRNPYQSQDRYNNQQQRGYNNRPSNYNNNRSYNNEGSNRDYSNNRSYNNEGSNRDYSSNRSYNNEGSNRDYNNNRSYNNEGGNQGYNNRGYNNRDNNRGYNNQGYNNNRGYSNNRDNNRSYNNNQGYNNNNNRGYSNNRGYNNEGNSYNRGYNDNNDGGYNNRNNYNDRGNSRGGYGNNDRGGNYGGGGYDRRPQPKPRSNEPKRIVKPVKYKENLDPDTPIRLNKYLANAGVCSRREADTFIASGAVKVNGEVVNELGVKVKRGDLVTFQDQPIRLESKVYVLLNKPKNCVTTSDDPENRLTVMDLAKNACPERIYPVGRLDRNTTGVLLLTNDGDLASKLTHPKFKKKKIYQVTLDRDVAIEDMQAIADGIDLDDGEIHADSIAYQSEDALNVVGIEIHSGRNRIVRRIFEKLGYQVIKLDRVYFAGLTKKNIPRGKWRYLSENEVNMLRMGAFE